MSLPLGYEASTFGLVCHLASLYMVSPGHLKIGTSNLVKYSLSMILFNPSPSLHLIQRHIFMKVLVYVNLSRASNHAE